MTKEEDVTAAPFPSPSLLPSPPAPLFSVTPAKAGVQGPAPQRTERPAWIPAFAGMTTERDVTPPRPRQARAVAAGLMPMAAATFSRPPAFIQSSIFLA